VKEAVRKTAGPWILLRSAFRDSLKREMKRRKETPFSARFSQIVPPGIKFSLSKPRYAQ
jgi:hypothetical protein